MKFNARLLVSFGIISLLLASPAYSQSLCDPEDTRRFGIAVHYDRSDPAKMYYGVSAKNEVQDVYRYGDHVINSISIGDPNSPGFFEVGWTQDKDAVEGIGDKYFFVAWKNTSGVYGVEPLGLAVNGYYQLWAFNNGEGKFSSCVCELDSNYNHVKCLYPGYTKETSYLGFDKGYVNAQGETMNYCDVSPSHRFTRLWRLRYGPNTGYSTMVPWDVYVSHFNYPLEPEIVVYKN